VWILGKGEPFWKPGGPALQEGERGDSWLQTAEVKGRSNMATGAGIVQQLYSIIIKGTVSHCIIVSGK
jgi:hypothetical protein